MLAETTDGLTNRSVGVEVTAHVLDLELELLLGALLGALYTIVSAPSIQEAREASYLEGKVLQEVRGAIGLVRLRAAAGVDPHADGRGLSPGRVLCGDLISIESALARRTVRDGAYREAVAEGGGLRLRAVAERSGQASGQRRPDGAEGRATAHGLLQVER